MMIRHDDFDFRLSPEEYKEIHQQFIEAEVNEIAVLQFAQFGRVCAVPEKLIQYILDTPYWDIQIHGWEHAEYDKMTFNECVRDLAACQHFALKYFGQVPSIWFPPWNRNSENMQRAALYMKMTISNESNDIHKFIREAKEGMFTGHSLYFHGWNRHERDAVPEMLKLVKSYESR